MSEKKGLFKGSMGSLGGNRDAAGSFSLNGFVNNLLPSAVSCGINALGGAMAMWVGQKVDHWKRGWGTVGVSVLAIAIKAAVQPVGNGTELEVAFAVRDLASGMAGYVGDEILEALTLMWKSTPWIPGKQWKRDDHVSYAGRYYVAAEDIAASDSVKPPAEDKRWVGIENGSKLGLEDVKECTRMVFQDKERVETITSFLASSLGKQRGWTEAEIADAKGTLSKAMSTVAEEIQKL